jgi:hypothetical protein
MYVQNRKYKFVIFNIMNTPIGDIISLNSEKYIFEFPQIFGYILRLYKID